MNIYTPKKLVPWLPEIYLLMSVIYYWTMTSTILNPVAIILLLILAAQIIFANNISGFLISVVFLLLNLYLVLALIDELNEFARFDNKALTLLFFGSGYLGLNILVALIMLKKWVKQFHKGSIGIDERRANVSN